MANEKLITLSNLQEFKTKSDAAYLRIINVSASTTLADIGVGAKILKLSSDYYICSLQYSGGTSAVIFEIENLVNSNRWISTTPISTSNYFVSCITASYQVNYQTASDVTNAINAAIASAYTIQGTASASDLNTMPKDQTMNGYVYSITDSSATLTNSTGYTPSSVTVYEGDNVVFVWNNGSWYWDKLAATIDISNFVAIKTVDANTAISTLVGKPVVLDYSYDYYIGRVSGTTAYSFEFESLTNGTRYLGTSVSTSTTVFQMLNPAYQVDYQTVANSESLIAPQFSNGSTYAVGDIVFYSHALYVCSTAVNSAGSWTGSTNWTNISYLISALVKTSGAQSIAGVKTFTTEAIFNSGLKSAHDYAQVIELHKGGDYSTRKYVFEEQGVGGAAYENMCFQITKQYYSNGWTGNVSWTFPASGGTLVVTSRTIAGNDLSSNISAQTLTDSLVFADNTNDIDAMFN